LSGRGFFGRLFADGRANDRDETLRLYGLCREQQARLDMRIEVMVGMVDDHIRHLPDDLYQKLQYLGWELIKGERHIWELPPPELDRMTLSEQVGYRAFLRQKENFFHNKDQVLQLLYEAVTRIIMGLADALPLTEDPSPFSVPMICAVAEPQANLQRILNTLNEEKYFERGLFLGLKRTLAENMCRVSRIDLAEVIEKRKWHVLESPDDSKLPLTELNDAYMRDTPFHAFFRHSVPLKLNHQERFSHMHVVGGSGAGKTTLLQNLILHDLKSENRPALIVIDSQGDLIGKLSRLALFDPERGELRDKLVLISPKDIHHPPAVNIFDINRERLGTYDEATKEQVVAGVIQTFDYLFAGLLGADLTAKQGVFFRFVARLMLTIPETMGRNATILDMINLMDRPEDYRVAIAALPPIQKAFFERDFVSKTFAPTKEQIRYRLNAILENPTLARLFTSPSTKIDLFTEMNRDAVILVDTAKDFLKGASGHFGRIFISLVLQAVLERAAIPEEQRRPAFLIVDEAAAYFDSNIDDLLTEARKYKVGCVFAHQFLDQCSSSLRASLAANTSIKLAGGVSTGDARVLAPDLRTGAEFILSQPKLHFAAHIRNVTPQAVSIPVAVGILEAEPRLSEGAYESLRVKNRAKVSLAAVVRAAGQSDTSGTRDEPECSSEDPSAPSPEW
jgi:hypothetical protein